MALARSHEMEHDWPAAIRAYDELLALFPTNAAAPRAEFLRALASDQAGRETNALSLFTNFLARFPGDALAPRAQDWIGDFYFRNEDFAEAERNYQRLYQNTNWPATELMFEAKFKAGRAEGSSIRRTTRQRILSPRYVPDRSTWQTGTTTKRRSTRS